MIKFLMVAALAFACVGVRADEDTESLEVVGGAEPSLLPAGRSFRLVWNDEFLENRLDTSKWMFRTNFWGERFRAFAAADEGAVVVTNGCAHLKIIKRGEGDYASPQLQTGELMWDYPIDRGPGELWPLPKRQPAKFLHRFGYYECRAKLQSHTGWWSAFWLQSENNGTCLDAERSGVEADIMESFEPGRVLPSCFHCRGYGPFKDYIGFESPRLPLEKSVHDVADTVDVNVFHRFGMLWEPDGYTLYIDGRQRGPKVGRGQNRWGDPEQVSQVPQFVLLTTEVKWYRKNCRTGKALLPDVENAWKAGDEFVVDYVRVFDLED